MITEQAKERCRILAFWEKHGDVATKEAFKVSRRTLFRWQRKLNATGGKLEGLNKMSCVPKKKRQRNIPESVKDFILKERKFDPHLSKDKLAVLMKEDGIANLSASTVGRMLNDLKRQGLMANPVKISMYAKTGRMIERKPRKSRKKLRSKGHEGGLVKADTIVRFINGMKRYIVTAIDKETKFAFAFAYKNHSSDSSTDFMKKFKSVAPVSLTHVQTDNGSEFEKHFHLYLEKSDVTHFNTYPRCPKMNSEIERFNRTLSDAFIKRNRMLLAYDADKFNEKLIEWLLWYNTRRPHWTLGLISPLRYICNQLTGVGCQRLWTDTKTCQSP
jgi:transposase InsO family protein